jgi:hypothetical protein
VHGESDREIAWKYTQKDKKKKEKQQQHNFKGV